MKYLLYTLVLFGSSCFSQTLPRILEVSFRKDTFNILAYGAKPDGVILNTSAISRAIKECNLAGGGTVIIPQGLWLTGPIILMNNVNLHIAKGALLQFSNNTNDYSLVTTNWEGLMAIRCQSPIYGEDLENIAITGNGILDGAGEVWRPVKQSKLTISEWNNLVKSGGILNEQKDTWYPSESALNGSKAKRPGVIAEGYDLKSAEKVKDFLRPNMVSLIRCTRILLEGVTFQNSPAWCLHPLLSQHLTLRNLTVRNPWNAQNGDGVDIESCRYVLVEHCTFDVGDDGICIKSGRDEEGRKRNVPTEDVIIRNCTVFHGHGGFVIGSEMSGGARNIFVSDCNFLGTDVGLRFKTTRGRGGVVENIYVDRIRMTNIGGVAILFDMYYQAKDPLAKLTDTEVPVIEFQPVTETTPQFKNFFIKDVVCKGAATGIFIQGLPEMNIQDIHLEDITIQSNSGLVCKDAKGITLRHVALHTKEKHVIDLQDSKNITIENLTFNPSDVLMKINGSRSKDIRLVDTNTSSVIKVSELGSGVSANVLLKK